MLVSKVSEIGFYLPGHFRRIDPDGKFVVAGQSAVGEIMAAEIDVAVIDDYHLGMAGFLEGVKTHLDTVSGEKRCGGTVFPVEKILFIPGLFENHVDGNSTPPGLNQLIGDATRHVAGMLGNFKEVAGDDDAGASLTNPGKESSAVVPVDQQGSRAGLEHGRYRRFGKADQEQDKTGNECEAAAADDSAAAPGDIGHVIRFCDQEGNSCRGNPMWLPGSGRPRGATPTKTVFL